MGDVQAKPIVDTLPDNRRQAKDEINFQTIDNWRAKVLIDTMPKTVLEAKPSALYYLKVEVLIDTLEGTLLKHEK